MSSKRNRIIYASQSVIVDGEYLYRVQTLGSTTTFTSEDVFELGQLDIIDVVDDVPAVAITMDTNEWGSIDTLATLANVDKTVFGSSAVSTASLAVVSGTLEIGYYHGVSLSHFGATNYFDLWAPVQSEAALGTASNSVDQTLYMPSCYINSLEFGYSTGANATENYGAETDTKYWFLNGGRFVSQEEWDCTGAIPTVTLGLIPTASGVAQLSDSSYAFLYSTEEGERAICHISAAGEKTYYAIDADAETAAKAQYNTSTNVVDLPTGLTTASGDKIKVRYAANAYALAGVGDADRVKSGYFTALAAGDASRPEDVGAVRQGQVEIYLVDPDVSTVSSPYELSLRLTSCTVTANLTREALNELGHLKPYDRPLTFPVEITTAVETTAGDLETFAKFAGKGAEYDAATLKDITIDNLMTKDNLILVVMIYQQTDEEAGGTGSSRKVLTAEMAGNEYFVRGVRSTYSAINPASPEREYPLKTLIVPGLKITDEAFNNSVGANATQTFSFRSVNKLFAIMGYVDIADVLCTPGIQVNA